MICAIFHAKYAKGLCSFMIAIMALVLSDITKYVQPVLNGYRNVFLVA